MAILSNLTDEQLLEELEIRKKQKAELERPKPVQNPDFSALIKTCEGMIEECARGERDDDTSHYIYEAAMTAVYGNKVFDWMNKR